MRHTRGLTATAAVAALLLLFSAGCARDTADPADADSDLDLPVTEIEGELDRSRDMPADVTVDVTGAVTFTWQSNETVTLTRVGQPELSTNLLSFGFIDYHRIPSLPNHRFRWAVDLIKAYRDQPGTFTLTDDTLNAQGFKDLAWFLLLDIDPAAADSDTFTQDDITGERQFIKIAEPCTLVVGEGESTGSLTCPKLTLQDDSQAVSMTVTWTETPG